MSTIFGMIMDVGLGLIALKLVLSLEKAQKQMMAMLSGHETRITKLEARPVGFMVSYEPETTEGN